MSPDCPTPDPRHREGVSDPAPNPFAAALDALVGTEAADQLRADGSAPRTAVARRARTRTRGAQPTAEPVDGAAAPDPPEPAGADRPGDAPADAPVPSGLAPVGVPLAAFGLDATRDATIARAGEVLAVRGHTTAVIEGLRWGCLTVRCDPVAAAAVRVDADQILAALAQAGCGTVAELRVRTGRG